MKFLGIILLNSNVMEHVKPDNSQKICTRIYMDETGPHKLERNVNKKRSVSTFPSFFSSQVATRSDCVRCFALVAAVHLSNNQ